ncbi:GNAT family acetyltransferase [Natronomonas moolapensis 8.8.11]|uniref:GNAT family acetyltransferase n=1 Tax=Natronomonas moolapensis (strain DSM 18674 / CECT 7526 / JCM 14361 / 8.8.11) TaxID=268739 RepID=M1XN11_NATM8|nr:GNAT family N-acetyltransferase [Natronomonas moolapensis]CCQ35292.1 GNAT family acetyltransferase [Natronomonas moolapensis 8.8.11]
MSRAVAVRPATPDEYVTARSILEGALLTVERGRLARSSTLVAVAGDRIVGALVLDGCEVDAVAVRPGRRGQGVGTALVEAAVDRRPSLSAGFDPSVRAFYTALGFDVRCSDGRCRGRRSGQARSDGGRGGGDI